MKNKELLFSPLELTNITLPGRIVRSATELFAAGPDAHIPQYEVQLYRELAAEPLGMIITAHTCVSPEGRSNLYQNAIWSDEYLQDAMSISEAVAGHVPVIMQLGHGGMKAEGNNGNLPVYTPDNMTTEQIKKTVIAFGAAAKRAMSAGIDGIMLHAAHMYLLSQFFYPCYNHRNDEYGGCAENRFRIIREIVEEIKTVCGEKTPVFMKINGDDRDDTEEYNRDIVKVLRICSALKMDAVEISGYASARSGKPDKPYFIENISRLKNETDVPLIAVGGIRTTDDMDNLLDAGASAVSLSRPLLVDPHMPTEILKSGEYHSDCIGCGFCFSPLKMDKEKIIRCPRRTQEKI